MNKYLIKQFYRNKAYVIALLILFFAGSIALYTGKKFLDKNESIIDKSEAFQMESLDRNTTYHKDDLGLILYYVKFNLINEMPKLAALHIGVRDINPSIQGVTIRNLEEQKHNSDFYNPANSAVGNFDFSFVLIFIFPLVIIALCFNMISEEEESGTWKLISVQSGNVKSFLNSKLSIRFLAVSAVYIVLLLMAVIFIKIPVDLYFTAFFFSGWLYLIFWFALCRWIISFQKSSSQNALIFLIVWVGMNFIVPMTANIIIQKVYPVNESLEAMMQQREGYHNKWDEPKKPTMEKFYKVYPQFRRYTVEENNTFTWVWYYAMQHMGDMESHQSAGLYFEKVNKRNHAAEFLGYFLPNIHTQMVESNLAKTGVENQQNFAVALQKFHTDHRLFFYPLIFSGKNANAVDWTKQKVQTFSFSAQLQPFLIFAPYLIFIILFIFLSEKKLKKLC